MAETRLPTKEPPDEAGREAERRYRVLFETSRDAMMVVDPSTYRFLSANPATLEFFGVKDKATFTSLTPWDLSPVTQPDGRPSMEKAREIIEAVLREGSRYFEWRHRKLDGQEFPATVLLTRLDFAGQTLVQATVRDRSASDRSLSALRNSEERLRLVIEATGMGTYHWDHATRKPDYSPEFLALYGLPPDGTLTLGPDMTPLAVLDEDRPGFLAAMQAGNDPRGDGVFKAEFRICRPDGSIHWLMARGRTEFEGGPGQRRPSRAAGMIMDITERKRAEEEIALLKHAIDVHSDAAYWTDSQGRFFYVNEAGYRTLGYEPGELIGKSIAEVNPGATADRLKQTWDILRTQGAYRVESTHRRKDGSEFPVEIHTSYVRFGGKEYSCGLAREISERKQAEAALRESEERFRASFMTSLDAFYWATLQDGLILEVNPVFETVYGYSRDEVIGKTSLELGMYYDPGDCANMVAELQDKGFVRDLEMKARKKDGQIITISLSGRKVVRADQEFLLGVIRDISGRKRAEEEKAALTRQFQQAQKMESVGRLAGGIAHDFNNMLGVILGYSELALDRMDPGEPLHEEILAIRAAAQRSADLTRQLLAFARKQTTSPKVLDLNDTVAGVLKMARRLIGEDIKLTWLPGEHLWPVKIDPTQIDQILANLCVNARDAITDVGEISIKTGTAVLGADGVAPAVGVAGEEFVWLAVGDNGCGMNETVLAHAFEPFFTTKEVGKGTGLGLATVYGIVKQNGGFVDVHSEVNVGTMFTIYLPRHQGKDSAAEGEKPGLGTVQLGQETILLVEDEAPLLEVTQKMLERHGYKVLPANTPGRALELAREHAGSIDLLISDVVMPEMNGRDLAKNVLFLYPDARCLFMSGYTAHVIAHQGVLEEGVLFIQKPFTSKDLAALARQALDAKRGPP